MILFNKCVFFFVSAFRFFVLGGYELIVIVVVIIVIFVTFGVLIKI